MRKPRNYDNTAVFGSYEPIPAGNYLMMIHRVEETIAKTSQKQQLVVWLDIAEGEHSGRIMSEFKVDKRTPPVWGMKFYVSVEDDQGNCHKALKTFINAVEKSNRFFNEADIWNDNFANYFRDCVLGASIRREEYINQQGERKWSSKVSAVFPMDEIESRPVPTDKPLEEHKTTMPSYMSNHNSVGFGVAGDGFSSRRSMYSGYGDDDRREPTFF